MRTSSDKPSSVRALRMVENPGLGTRACSKYACSHLFQRFSPTAGAAFGGARGGRSGNVVDGLVPLAHQVIDDSGRAAILVGVNGGAVVGGGFADEHDWKFSRRLVSDEIGDAFLQHYDDTIHRLTLHAIDGGGKRAFRTVAHGLDGD
mgnify:CR=1 FL=1